MAVLLSAPNPLALAFCTGTWCVLRGGAEFAAALKLSERDAGASALSYGGCLSVLAGMLLAAGGESYIRLLVLYALMFAVLMTLVSAQLHRAAANVQRSHLIGRMSDHADSTTYTSVLP
jgi:hypothetical protein